MNDVPTRAARPLKRYSWVGDFFGITFTEHDPRHAGTTPGAWRRNPRGAEA